MRNFFTLLLLTMTLAVSAQNDLRIEEYYEMRPNYNNERLHFVLAYDKEGNRSSETVYNAELQDDGSWSEETLFDRGIYKYEYDAQGRLAIKSLVYENDQLDSYCTMISYADDGTVNYTRYSIWDGRMDNDPYETWSYRDGKLASYGELKYGERLKHFNEYGAEYWIEGTDYGRLHIGTVNDSTEIRYELRSDDETGEPRIKIEDVFHHRYDPVTGHLLEYSHFGEYSYSDDERHLYVYDDYGRLVRHETYRAEDDDDEWEIVPPVSGAKGTSSAASSKGGVTEEMIIAAMESKKPTWELESVEEYSYYGTEKYSVGNPWHDIFKMEGPCTKITYTEDDVVETVMTLNRDENGKLLSIETLSIEEIDEWGTFINKRDFTIDDLGQITATELDLVTEYPPFDDINGDGVVDDLDGWYERSSQKTTYTWENGLVTESHFSEVDESTWGNGSFTVSNVYSYGPGSITIATTIDDGEPRYVSIEQDGAYLRLRKDSNEEIHYTQPETVAFLRPVPQMDPLVPEPQRMELLTVKDRHVVLCDNSSDGGFNESLIDEKDYFFHGMTENFLDVKHEGSLTKVYDKDGFLLYVLEDDRILNEYNQLDYCSPVYPGEMRAQAGLSTCEEIAYEYGEGGELTKRTLREYDSNGEVEKEVTLTYRYSGSVGIEMVEGTAQAGVSLNGRVLGARDGSFFSVYDLGGNLIAAGQKQMTLSKAGIYIIKVDGMTVKMLVK